MTELLLLTYGKFALASLMLLAFFFAVLRGRASYKMQRLYLIMIPFASLAMSGFTIEVYKPKPRVIEMTRTEILHHHAANVQRGYHYEAEEGGSLEELDINPLDDLASVMEHAMKDVYYGFLVLGVLFSVSAILLFIATFYIIKMCMFSRRMKAELTEDGLRLVRSASIKSAFSFGKTIFLPVDFDKEKTTYVLTHEKAHIALKHYVDVWVIEFMVRLLWFNPFLWVVRKQLRNVHEYEADRCVVNSGADILRYQTFLLEEVTESSLVMANGFNHSFIRQRFIEMKKSSVGRLGIAGKTATVLWAIVLFCAFTFTVGNAETIVKYKAQKGRTEQKAIAEEERLEEEELDVIEEEDKAETLLEEESQPEKEATAESTDDSYPIVENIPLYTGTKVAYKGFFITRNEASTTLTCVATSESDDELWSLCGWDTYIIDAETGDHYKARSSSVKGTWETKFHVKGMKGKMWHIDLVFPPLPETVKFVKISGVYDWEQYWNKIYRIKELER